MAVYFVNDCGEVPGERVLVDVLAEEVVLGGEHDLGGGAAGNDVERVPEVHLRGTRVGFLTHQQGIYYYIQSEGIKEHTLAVRMKMTKRGLPSSSILGSCGMRRCCWDCRSDQPLPPRASTTSARLAGFAAVRASCSLHGKKEPALASPGVRCRSRADLSDTPPTTSMDACVSFSVIVRPPSRGRSSGGETRER